MAVANGSSILQNHLSVPVSGGDVIIVDQLSEQATLQQYIQYKSKNFAGREDVQDAFCVIDLGRLMDIHAKWKASLPSIQPFYAVKCNDDVMVLKTLAAMGTGFDCSSKNEIKMVLDLGVAPDRIIYANTCKQLSHIKYAISNGVDLMTFDNKPELHKIKDHFPNAKLVLRIAADCPDALLPLGRKFGCTLSDAKDLLQDAKLLDLEIVGVCFHVGSRNQNPSYYQHALELAYEVFQYAAGVGYHLTLLDIGGGFPGKKDDSAMELFDRTAIHINEGLEKFNNISNLKIIAEPGRFYPCCTYAIAVSIIGKRFVEKSDEGKPMFTYFVSDGIYGAFNCAPCPITGPLNLFPTILKDTSSVSQKYKTILWGPSSDALDKLFECDMPELEMGDWIYFNNMGAYSVSMATTFNGFEKPASHYYIRESKSDSFSSMMTNLNSQDTRTQAVAKD